MHFTDDWLDGCEISELNALYGGKTNLLDQIIKEEENALQQAQKVKKSCSQVLDYIRRANSEAKVAHTKYQIACLEAIDAIQKLSQSLNEQSLSESLEAPGRKAE
jgi:hypothetical protein